MTVRIYSCGHSAGNTERIDAPCLACSHNHVEPPPATAYAEVRTPLPVGSTYIVEEPPRRTHAERRAMWLEARRQALQDMRAQAAHQEYPINALGVRASNNAATSEVYNRMRKEIDDATS